ncbi:trigger factor [Bacilli bacterium PM5-3]|nr:trigger factor [Bacilli bacterium PM5-3]MDH6603941.1 trigger factor [Bacilli bacterium PM5-9]
MKTEMNKKENSMVEITVSANKDAWKDAQKAEFEKAAKEVEIDGFRKGKAPLAKVKAHINEFDVLSKAADTLLNDMYSHALKEHDIWPVAQPNLNVEAINEDELKVIFEVATKPEFEVADYKGLSANKETAVVEEGEIDAQLEALRAQSVSLEVKDKEIENGDTAVIDFEGFKDDVAFEGGKAEAYPLEIGSGQFIPGFEEQLIGKKAGDEVDVEVTFPEEYQQADLAGKPVVFKVKVHEVKVKIEAEINDDLAKGLGIDGIDTVAALKEDISKRLLEQKQNEAEMNYTNDLIKQISDKTEINIPQPMIDGEIDALYQQFMQRLQAQGMNEEMFLQMTSQTKEDVRKQMEEDAIAKIKYTLILEKIAQLENIQVSAEDIEAEYEKIGAMYNMEVEQIKQMIPDTGSLEFELKMQKAADLIKENVK